MMQAPKPAKDAVSAAFAGLGACIILLWMRPTPRLRGVVRWLLGHLPPNSQTWMTRQLGRGAQGLAVAGSARAWLGLLVLSVLQWSCVVAAIAASAAAVSAYPGLGACILVFCLMVLGLTLPAPPVQVGATQWAFVFGLRWAGLGAEQGLAASLVYTAAVLAWMLLAGTAAGLGTRWARSAVTQEIRP
jgi:hypothetical protein